MFPRGRWNVVNKTATAKLRKTPVTSKLSLILTATIAPKGENGQALVRSDPATRTNDYISALKFWLGLDAPWLQGIVFAENSGRDLTHIRSEVLNHNPGNIPIEFLSFDHPAPPAGLHYGYSEYILLREALAASPTLAASRYFIKATGRYTFPSISKLVQKLPDDFAVAVDTRLSRPLSKNRNYVVQFALALFERQFFTEHLLDIPERMKPAPPWTRSQFVENVLYERLTTLRSAGPLVLRWPCNCEPSGTGANGDDYSSWLKNMKAKARALGRVVAPALWL